MDYDKIAGAYDVGVSDDLDTVKLERELVKYTGITNPSGWKILDIGCGSGIQCQYLVERFPKISGILGIDSSEELIRLAEQRNSNSKINYSVADLHKLPSADASFDYIYSRYTVHYSNDLTLAMKEIKRVSKPGAQIFLQVVHPTFELFRKPSKDYGNKELATFPVQGSDVTVSHITHTIAEYLNSLLSADLNLIEIMELYGGRSEISGYRVPTILILKAKN